MCNKCFGSQVLWPARPRPPSAPDRAVAPMAPKVKAVARRPSLEEYVWLSRQEFIRHIRFVEENITVDEANEKFYSDPNLNRQVSEDGTVKVQVCRERTRVRYG